MLLHRVTAIRTLVAAGATMKLVDANCNHAGDPIDSKFCARKEWIEVSVKKRRRQTIRTTRRTLSKNGFGCMTAPIELHWLDGREMGRPTVSGMSEHPMHLGRAELPRVRKGARAACPRYLGCEIG